MHDHARDALSREHKLPACIIFYLLSFNLMAGKRKFHLVVLSSGSNKAKKDRDKFRATTWLF